MVQETALDLRRRAQRQALNRAVHLQMAQQRESAAKHADVRVAGDDDRRSPAGGRGLDEVAFVTHRRQARSRARDR